MRETRGRVGGDEEIRENGKVGEGGEQGCMGLE